MEKDIFEYWDGKKTVKRDPMVLEMNLYRASAKVDFDTTMKKVMGPDWEQDPGKWESASDADRKLVIARRFEGIEELIPIVCDMFGFYTFEEDNENGLTMAEILQVWTDYQMFVSGVKKNTNLSQDLPLSTDLKSQETTTKPNLATTTTPKPPSGFVPSPSQRGFNSP